MKHLALQLSKYLSKRFFITILSFVFVGVGVSVLIPEKACASCTNTPLFDCPASIVVWSGASIPFNKYGAGTLPNGHEYCGYYGFWGGDAFSGAFDRVAGRQATFGRSVNCIAGSYDDGGYYGSQPAYDCTFNVGQYVELQETDYGAKCVDLNYADPQVPASLGVGTDSNFFIHHNCEDSYEGYAANGIITGTENQRSLDYNNLQFGCESTGDYGECYGPGYYPSVVWTEVPYSRQQGYLCSYGPGVKPICGPVPWFNAQPALSNVCVEVRISRLTP